MKNIFVCCLILTLSSLRAQDSLHLKVGLFFAPQTYLSLKKPGDGFATITPVSAVASFSKGKSVVNVMYSLSYNKVQIVYWHKLGKPTGLYAAFNKSVFDRGGYASLGVTRGVAEGRAVGFLEIGSTWHVWNPQMYMGAIIPLTFQVK